MKIGYHYALFAYYFRNLMLMKFLGRAHGFVGFGREDDWGRLLKRIEGHDTWLVVGNGPSLNIEDLEALSNIPSIASNKINLLFSRTNWRPTLYTIADPLLLHKLSASHYDDFPLVLLPHTHVFMCRAANKLPWRHIQDKTGSRIYVEDGQRISPSTGLFVGATITCPNLELAIWAGAKTIYLIGCDHFYANEDGARGASKVVHKGGANHFDPNYRRPGELVNSAPVERMNNGYQMIRNIADSIGVRIINISRTSALTVFERGTVDEAINLLRK